MRKTIFLLFMFLILLTTACSGLEGDMDGGVNPPENLEGKDGLEEEEGKVDPIREKIGSMSLDEKLGQLLIVGFEGTSLDEDLRFFIEDLKVGGVIYFKRNIESIDQVIGLNRDLKELSRDKDIPLFLSIDEEGGNVSRLSQLFTNLPPASKLGAMDEESLSFEYGEILGMKLKALSFNLNFAPVMDINSNVHNPVIGTRALGNNPSLVSRHGLQVIKGMKSQDIISSIKHFPGHGDTSTDSHIGLPVVEKSLEELGDFEFIPFKDAIDKGVDMVMVGHMLFSKIDNTYPATLSRKIINNLLRDDLNFSGLIISDDLTMGAITKNYGLEEAALKFLQAGGDIGLVCHGMDNPKSILDYLANSVKDGSLSIEDIDDKLYRILGLKEKYNLLDRAGEDIDIEGINLKTRKLLNKIH